MFGIFYAVALVAEEFLHISIKEVALDIDAFGAVKEVVIFH